ncbi:MAG TPA: carbohydrate kinase family protein [Anaerolineales bacterium]|nr:carbohydrate kinase family protein [Anaerolineales bacterium]
MSDVLCFGNLQLDVLCRTVTELPPPGSLQKIDTVDFALSGNGGSLAMALARLGVSVDLAGYSGADVIGDQFRTMLMTEGVGIDKLTRHPTAGTGTSIVTVAPTGERSIFYVNGANDEVNLESVPDDWLHGLRILAVTSVFVLPHFTGEAIAQLFQRAHAAGARTVLNICWDGEARGLNFLAPALAHSDYFVLNFDEGCQLTGFETPNEIIGRLMDFTSGTIILTLGAEGCCFRTESGIERVPAIPVNATDTTGAGDSFVAGFIAGLIRGRSLSECVQLGCEIAAYAVTGTGAYVRIPRYTEEV